MRTFFMFKKKLLFLFQYFKTIIDWLQNKKISGGFTENP